MMLEFNLTIEHLLLIIPPLIFIEGFFSGSEIALLSAESLEIKKKMQEGVPGARIALQLKHSPEKILSTTLLMTSLCVIGISTLIAIYFLQSEHPRANLLTILVASPIVVLFGELIPKALYQKFSNQVAPWVSWPILITFYLLYPITKIISIYTARLSRFIGPIQTMITGQKRTTRDELRDFINSSKKETDIKASEKRMIKRIFDFKDTEAKNALIPLVKVDAVDESDSIAHSLKLFQKHMHSRMPVYSERIDNIIGLIEAFDLLASKDAENDTVKKFIRPVHYIAETQVLEDVLYDMNKKSTEMSVIVDEHGGAVGILTFEDIVEEVVGDIHDEYDSESETYRTLGTNRWVIQANMEIEHINEKLNLMLPIGEYETLGGFLLQQFGRIPENRDELYFDTPSGSYQFSIRQASKRRIESVLVEKTVK